MWNRIGIIGAVLLTTTGVGRAQDASVTPERLNARLRQFCAYDLQNIEQAEAQQSPLVHQLRQIADRCLTDNAPLVRRQLEAEYAQERQLAAAAAQKERQAKVAALAEKQQADAFAKKTSSPAFVRARLSALLCYATAKRHEAEGKIQEQRRGARAGLGVIDKQKVYESQQGLIAMADLEKATKRDLKSAHTSAMECKAFRRDEFEAFSACVDQERNDSVDDSANESIDESERASVPCAAERSF